MPGKHIPRGKLEELHNKNQLVVVTIVLMLQAFLPPCSWLAASALRRSPHWTWTQCVRDKSTQNEVISIQDIFASESDFIFHNHLSAKKRKKIIITPPNHYYPFFWVYTLAQRIDLPALLLGMFIILSLTPSLLLTCRNKNSTHWAWGVGIPQLSVTTGKAKLGEVP